MGLKPPDLKLLETVAYIMVASVIFQVAFTFHVNSSCSNSGVKKALFGCTGGRSEKVT